MIQQMENIYMDKKRTFLWTLLGCLLLAGCQKETEEQNAYVRSNTLIDITDRMGCVEVIGAELSIELEDVSGRNTNAEKWYSSDNIVNYDESISAFHAYSNPRDNISREIVLGRYSENFPESLQEVLVCVNDDIPENDNAWMEYEAECEHEKITLEIDPYPVFEDVDALAVDINSDGEKEYIFSFLDMGTAHYTTTTVAGLIDGEWVEIGGYTTDYRISALLEWENQYYLLMSDCLTYWNSEAEEPKNWKDYPAPGQAECWIRLLIEKKVTGYAPLEVYRLESEFTDYLKNVDLTNLESNGTEDIESSAWAYWKGEANTFLVRYAWTQRIEGEEYRYIVSEIISGTDYKSDLLLAVCRQTKDERMEVIALYYLMANYEIEFSEKY